LRGKQRSSLALSFLLPQLLKVYLMSLLDLSHSEVVLVFSRAATKSKSFSARAILREFSGRLVTGGPIVAEAREELQYLLNGMRSKHGPELADIRGRVLYGTEGDPRQAGGRTAHAPIRGGGV
jgi:hypothetical protein